MMCAEAKPHTAQGYNSGCIESRGSHAIGLGCQEAGTSSRKQESLRT